MDTFEMKRGDLLPEFERTLTDGTGTAVVIPVGATLKLKMRTRGSETAKINANATIVNAATGEVKYTWAGTDTDTSGVYRAEFELITASKKTTFPNNGYILVRIRDDLD